ncbi:MAG: ABC transporter ATP-binding protein, partial [Bacilli bacterium]|nr:ABC transporter ATP-binding protein [Bacilli bacterium]
MLKLVNVGKIYSQEGNVSVGIRKVNLELSVGEFVAITGESGSGKTTLLNVLSGIDNYEEGEMYVNGEETSYFSTEDLEDYRNKYVGFIFQNYNIIDSYTVRENVEAALLFNGYPKEKIRERAAELIEKVGLTHRIRTKSSKLSGGEKQRVVIARALAKDPVIIACDEPTGNLDYDSSKQIIELLHEVSKDKLVLIVTHDFEEVKDYATRVIRVFDSEIKEDRILRPHEEANINFEELKVNKPKRGQLLPFSFKDLFASPKRLIFNSIVFFVMALMVLVSIGFYRNQTRRSESYETFGQFYNQDTRRIVMNKKDKSFFTDAELNEIKNLNGVDFIISNDILVDSKYNFSFGQADYNIYFDGYLLP